MVLSAASYLKKAVEADRLAQTATEEKRRHENWAAFYRYLRKKPRSVNSKRRNLRDGTGTPRRVGDHRASGARHAICCQPLLLVRIGDPEL